MVLAELGARFRLTDAAFVVEQLLDDAETGSLIAMVFDHRGDLLVSREGGPVLALRDTDRDGRPDKISTYCEQLKNVQGLLPLGQQLLAVGDGPEGGALYAVRDKDHDGVADDLRALVKFRGSVGEHGPHAIRLGRDGSIYVVIGNFSGLVDPPAAGSPYRDFYEGDVVQPRFEDPRGHAVGVAAPGATILRTDPAGRAVELVAGGLRNPYDLAVNSYGELFTYDADMEWDVGTPWYRPTRIQHVTAGAEFGWRSGWAKWPDYYLDALPAVVDMGAGSPTGVEFYDHVFFPVRYQGAMFAADWAQGRINVIRFTPQGASYEATSKLFLQGTPANITDLSVGPDGALWFCTGGRGTSGGIYRIRYKGNVPPEVTQFGEGLTRALNHPQLDAPWAQSQIAAVRRDLGDRWGEGLLKVLGDPDSKPAHRIRALDLLQLYGPRPSTEMLLNISQAPQADVRARSVYALGTKRDPEQRAKIGQRLEELLGDPDARVRRLACEAVARGSHQVVASSLTALLDDSDRFVAASARCTLAGLPADEWRELVLESRRTRVFLHGAVALLKVAADRSTADRIVTRAIKMFQGDVNDPGYPKGFISDDDFLSLLRTLQLALHRGGLQREEYVSLGRELVREYPSSHSGMNRELVRLLVALQVPEAAAAMADQLDREDVPMVEKLHIAAYGSRLGVGWDTASKLSFIHFYDAARSVEGGYSLSAYIEQFERSFLANLNDKERRQVLSSAADWPETALAVLAKLPGQPDQQMLRQLRDIDQTLRDREDNPARRLRVGIAAVLGQSGTPESLDYLRQMYRDEPERRGVVAMALSPHPNGENWALLVDALRTLEGNAAGEVLRALLRAAKRPQEATPFRHAILVGLRSDAQTARIAATLLRRWAGDGAVVTDLPPKETLVRWQAWYAEKFPDALPAELPKTSQPNKWSYQELLSYLESAGGRGGDWHRGETIFQQAKCAQCHRFAGDGETIGPDLTAIARRFQTKEIVEAIVYPSHVISDQYASKIVEANGRVFDGLVAPDGDDALVVLLQDGTKQRLSKEDVDEISPSRVSAMPEGLLNGLTLEEVADLFAFLRSESRLARETDAKLPQLQ